MTMEVELKYRIDDKSISESILNDEYLVSMEEKDSREKIYMKAVYFDTEDGILRKNDIAFRIRMEGSRIVASLKWNDSGSDGLHMREEINVPVNDEACFINPDPAVFKESEAGRDLLELLNNRPLQSLIETNFLRSRMRIDTGACICEVSVDEGEIITDNGNLPICELEIELFSGEKDELLEIGSRLAETYRLEPEKKSKYARGVGLLDQLST